MGPYLPNEVFELHPARPDERRARRLGLLDLRGWLFLGMGLAGILTVALIVTADESYAGIDGLRAVRALVPDAQQPDISSIPFLGGLVVAIHDNAPAFFAPSPDAVTRSSPPPSGPASAPSSVAGPTPSSAPAAQPTPTATPAPAGTTSPPASTAPPSIAPAPTGGPIPTPAPTVTPSPTPTGTPTPAPLAISTDRGGTAIVDLADLVPGDSVDRTITVLNSGTLAFRYAVSASQTASTALWTDPTLGLQLTVRTSGGAVLYAGPLSGLGVLAGPTTLAPGGTELLRYTFDFPASASNTFQGLVQDLTLVFNAVQFP